MSAIQLNLRLSDGGSFATSATVVRLFEGGFAVWIDANPQEILSRMTSISAAVADQIAKPTQWSSNQEIRSAIVSNPRTPTPLALKLLPTLPEPEIRHIAKSTGVSQALKQAALRIVISWG